MSAETVEIDVEILRETPDAYQVNNGAVSCWLPKSQIEEEVEVDDETTITIPEWLAIKKDLI